MTTITPTPREGMDRCDCGAKYWDGNHCHGCGEKFRGRKCEQNCGALADCYAIDPYPNGWGGDYCFGCVPTGFRIVDRYER